MKGFFTFFVALGLSAPAVAQDHGPSTVPDTDKYISAIIEAAPKHGATLQNQSNRNGLPTPGPYIRLQARGIDPEGFSIDPMQDCDSSTNCQWPQDIENNENGMKGQGK